MIVILSGKAQSGKTTTTKILSEMFDTAEVVIAKPLKDYARILTGWDGSEETKPRTFLQDLGHKIRFEMEKPDFLIQRAVEDIEILHGHKELIIVSDCRYKTELKYFKYCFPNALTIRLNRTDYESTLTPEQQVHRTEIDLDDYDKWDYVVNASNTDELREQLQPIIDWIEEWK